MADSNPTGRGSSVALSVPANHAHFLRRVFEAARDGIRADLAEFPDQLRDPKRLRREEAVYDRLLTALDTGAIVPDRDARDVLGDLARTIDAGNEYERVVCEHAALWGVLDQLDAD